MGVVYRAEDLRLGRHVALKFLPHEGPADGEALERFEGEARAASALNHPHICTLHDVDTHDGRPFIVMELLEGQTVRERIGARSLDLDAVLTLGIQAAEALEACARQGHRPPRHQVGEHLPWHGGPAKVLDFGLAKLIDPHDHHGEAMTAAPATRPGTTMAILAAAFLAAVAALSAGVALLWPRAEQRQRQRRGR